MKAKHKVLSTKKLEPSLVEKAIRIKPILAKDKWDEIFLLLEKKIEYAVFTSSNAVVAVKKYLNEYVNHLPQQWKMFCLSGKTKEVLMEDGERFGTIQATASSAKELAERIIESDAKELIFFCGDRRREELPSILQNAALQVHEVMVYEVEETPAIINDSFEAVLFFSPSAVQGFFSVNGLKKGVVCFAIGQTTAKSLTPFTTNKLYVTKEPTQEALLNEVINYFKTR